MQKLESKFTGHLSRDLERFGCLVIPYAATQFNQSGWPDRIWWHRLWQGFIEIKVKQNQTTDLQAHRIAALNAKRPGSAFVVRIVAATERMSEGFVENELGVPMGRWNGRSIELIHELARLTEILSR